MPRTSLKRNLDAIIVEKLKAKVIKGEWTSGQRIMADELAEEFGVSRTPVLQALRELVSERMLSIASNGNIFVPSFSKRQIGDICQVRILLETHAIRQICQSETLSLQKLQDIAHQFSESLEAGEEIDSRRLDLDFHRALVGASGNDCLIHIYTEVIGQFTVSNYLIAEQTVQKQEKAGVEHHKLLECMQNRDEEKACEMIAGHILRSRDNMFEKMQDTQED